MWTVTEEGVLRATNNAEGRSGIGIKSPKFDTVGLQASFRFRIIDAKNIQFKLNYEKNGHIGRFIIGRDGFFFQANKNRVLEIDTPKNFGKHRVAIPANQWHQFSVVVKGQTITGTLNDQASREYTYPPLENAFGTFELSIQGNSAEFDDVVLQSSSSLRDEKVGNHASEMRAALATAFDGNTAMTDFIANNCLDCHSGSNVEGSLDLESLGTRLTDAENMRRWVLVHDRVRKGEMPPDDYSVLEESEKREFLKSLSQTLNDAHRSQLETVLRRLNRIEYENTINDLFGIDMRLAELLPEDATKDGFDNNGEALALSAEQIEVYLDAAGKVLDRVIGTKTPPERISIDTTPRELIAENMYSRWFKLMENETGTIIYSSHPNAGSQLSGLKIRDEGTYRFRLHAKTYQTTEPVLMQVQTGVMRRDGKKRFLGYHTIPTEGRVVELNDYMHTGESIYPRPFGTLPNIATFLRKGERKIEEYDGPGLAISRIEVEGPLESWPPPSRLKLLGGVDLEQATDAESQAIFQRLLPRAFRRPARPEEIEKYTEKFRELTESGRTFEDSLRWTLRAVLCSPEFLFIEEPTTGENISDFALANRLSYFLWSTMPDDELLELASDGTLHEPSVLRRQTERMLAHPKSRALTVGFAHQWLDLRDIDATSPDTKLYPKFDEHLKHSMVSESERFFETVLAENRSLREFIDSDWLVINRRLADHYGIDGIKGDTFRRVQLPADSVRGGVMTQASVLKVTANGANTSPVTRGVWMLEKVMGIHPPPPPPNIPAVVPDVTGANTLRQLLAKHRGEDSCNACHRMIDPPGFALEQFDAIGSWRSKYQFQGSRKLLPVDSSGETAGGDRFEGIRDYKKILLSEIDQVAYGLAGKLTTYATGRSMGFSDRSELKQIVKKSEAKDYSFREMIHEVIQSPLFRTP